MKDSPTLISGLFSHSNDIPEKILDEVKTSLDINPWYKEKILFLSGDAKSYQSLKKLGVNIYHSFEKAPHFIINSPAFRMKHWMVYQMLKQFEEVIWVDWDTISMKPLDEEFFTFCRKHNTPKFLFIPGYHATVNCSVYYVNQTHLPLMEKSFASKASNDELMWLSVLPKNIKQQPEFWWDEHVVNVWLESECSWVTPNTYFAHVKTFDYLKHLNALRFFSSDY